MNDSVQDITSLLLQRMSSGDEGAADELLALVYEDLRRLAGRAMGGLPPGHTLQPTAIVHEAYLKMVHGQTAEIRDRGHFLAVASRAMRSILVDHARARATLKRGGDYERTFLDELAESVQERTGDLLDLEQALGRLQAIDPELVRTIELRFFAGLSIPETAEATGVSTPTVERRWRFARAFLYRALVDGEST